MEKEKDVRSRRGKVKVSKETERIFFFYATVAMFLLWVTLELFGG